LEVAAGSPSVVVNQNTATITASLDGTAGFTKSGAGTLVLKGDNPLGGTLNIDVGSTADNNGAVRLASPNAASSLTGIQIRNNNNGYSALELDGTLGGVTTPAAAPVSLSGRSGTVPAVRNLAGSNTLAGTVTLQSGGGNYYFQSDAGTLNLNGALTSNAPTTTRSVTFQGAGNITLNGVFSNGTTTAGVGLIKNNAGTLALAGSNTFSGNVTINGGVLSLLNSGAVYAGGWNNTTVVTINSGGTLELDRWGYGPTNATYRTQSLGGLDYNPARLVINGGTIRYSGGAAGAPQNPAEAPYGPGFTIGANGATLNAAKTGDTWTVKFDSRGTGDVASAASGTLILTGNGDGILDKVLPGAGGLIKSGLGTWTLPRVNTYSGTTTASGGTLLVNGSTSTGAVTVGNSATLGGIGTLGGALTVQPGGNLAPGAGGIGKLTTSSAVVLQPGSTTHMEIHKTAGTRDVLAAGTTLAYGGTLTVTNLGGTLTAGDSFTLFQAGTIAGTFSAFSLPALNPGFTWNTGTLSSGTLSVIPDPSTYPGWAYGYAFPGGTSASTSDADGDGIANALEWLFGSNPLTSDSSFLPQPSVRPVSTTEYPAAIAGKNYLTMTATVRKIHTGMNLIPQANGSLESLDAPESAGFVESFIVTDLGDFEQRTWIYTQAIENGGRGFMRLKMVEE
jgi:autotransporter-associated beta strand protein